MTDKTPIEKAAEAVHNYIEDEACSLQDVVSVEDIADIIRRRMEKEVPERSWEELSPQGQSMYSRGAVELYNQCRRDIGLRDEEETT